MDYSQFDEIPRHKKKSKSKTPKKSKHKHIYEPCVIERPLDWYKKEHERSGEKKCSIGTYCPICGKVGELQDFDRWYCSEQVPNSLFVRAFHVMPTEEGKRELNPETRTLPTFWTDDIFPKYFELNESGK